MAITNFIPTVWSENLLNKIQNKYSTISNCTREYEGDIKEKGSVVKIVGVGHIQVGDYTKNTDMDTPQSLTDTVCELAIDQAKYFNFQIDDIEKAQSSPKLMNAAMELAANSLANEADKYVYSLYNTVQNFVISEDTSAEKVINAILDARLYLYQNGVGDDREVILEISPEVALILMRAKMSLSSDNTATIENGNGALGKLFGCTVHITNNIYKNITDTATNHMCVMRTKRSVAFASQISEIHAYRPEKRFADAVKGLYLYGASVIYPDEYFSICVGFPFS